MNLIVITLAGLTALAVLTFLYLPAFLRLLGIHRHYKIPEFDMTGRRALLVCTNHDRLDPLNRDTGAFGSEFTVPYYAFVDAGMEVEIASPKGGVIPVQPWSWPLVCAEDKRFKADRRAMHDLNHSKSISDLDSNDFDVIFMAGGWGAAYDLMQSEALARFITRANAAGKIVSSVCHGALGLCSAKGIDGRPLVKGRRVTGVTNNQINTFGIAVTPKHPEEELRKLGALYECQTAFRDPFASHVSIDNNLITGQNQNSGYETEHRILEKMATQGNL